VFKIIEDDIAVARWGYRVFAQTCLGEILSSPDDDAFHSINSKRVDILIVNKGGWPALAVEYQGNGHYQGTAAARDAIKKEALRKAGVQYVEISADHTAEQIRSRIRELLGRETV
jgi:undecaprenyl pyrophosphate synthase